MHMPTQRRLLNLASALGLIAACSGDDAAGTDTNSTTVGSTSVATTSAGTTSAGTTSAGTTSAGTGSESDSMGSTDPSTTTMGVTTTTDPSTTDPSTTDPSTTDPNTTGEPCAEGTIICERDTAKTCDGQGGYSSEELCEGECIDGVGCTLCAPGTYTCEGDKSLKCAEDGQSWEESQTCDGLQGISCDENSGKCAGACAIETLGLSYIGCDYYPTTLVNLHETQPWNFNYAVVVANTSDVTANITITRGPNPVTTDTVGPNTAKVITLPYVDQLVKPTINESGPTLVVTDGAYRLRSDKPITVYQYEPLQYQSGNLFSYTNDASLLLPVNTWTGNYIVASRNHWPIQGFNLPGWYAVVASKDDTQVTLKPSKTGGLVAAGGGVAANGTGVVTLNEGDVLEVFTVSGGGVPDLSDLTGTIIEATKPVQVFAGHKCTQVPVGTQACDRLEEAMLPIETLAKKYIITPPLIPTGGNTPKPQMVRVIATEDATTITYDPPQGGAPTSLAMAGDYFEIAKTGADFEIASDKKILVAQYMQGQQAGGNSGDPAMAIAVATDQYRSKYLIHAPTNYESNYVNLTAPMGAVIQLDGAPVGGFVAIGATGFGVARVKVNNNGDGNHILTGDKAFGVHVYGYGQYTSYWYPGGLDLELLPQ
jgi:hypothetical protein